MRIIGYLESEGNARTFSDYLYVQGIENQWEAEGDGKWAIWVHAEEEIERASELLSSFRHRPSDPRFQKEAKVASTLRERQKEATAAYRKKVRHGGDLFRKFAVYGMGPLTLTLTAISVGVFLLSHFGSDLRPIRTLFITQNLVFSESAMDRLAGLTEIQHGQIWRLFTPMFIHGSPISITGSIIHILFNMLWLRDLGSMIEGRQSTRHLALLAFGISAISNLGQYLVSGPKFGGMSGVVYGLLGYIWMRGKFDPASGLFLHPSTVQMMLIWFVLCFTPLIPNIANTAHAVGLAMGMTWGYLSSLGRR